MKNKKHNLEQKVEKVLYILSRLDLSDTKEFNKYYSLLGTCFKAYNNIEENKHKIVYTQKYNIQRGEE